MLNIASINAALVVAIFGMCFSLILISAFHQTDNYWFKEYKRENHMEYMFFILLSLSIAVWSLSPLLTEAVDYHAWKWSSLLIMVFCLSLYFLTLYRNSSTDFPFYSRLLVITFLLTNCLLGLLVNNWQYNTWIIITIIIIFMVLSYNVILVTKLARIRYSNFYKIAAALLLTFTILISLDNISNLYPIIDAEVMYIGAALIMIIAIGIYSMDQAYLYATRDLKEHLDKMREEYEATVENIEDVVISLARTIDAKDRYTEGHTERVSQYAVFLGERLGMSDKALENLRIGALVHDIGKIGISQNILNKPGRLTPEERYQIEAHPILGEEICKPLKALKSVSPIIRNHHEKLDGSGYPDGLQGDEIPLEVRIVTIVDIFDALTTNRSYRRAVSIYEALKIIKQEAREGKLDTYLVDQFEVVLQEMFMLVRDA